jgi:DNA-binding transcriptional ArsR family regulator
MDPIDELFRAIAHPARREIIRYCQFDWIAAGELTAHLDLSPATVSEHLKVLRKSELVELKIEGTWRYYRALPSALESMLETLTALRKQGATTT